MLLGVIEWRDEMSWYFVSKGAHNLSTASSQFIFVLLSEAVTDREEVPASLLVHVPHVRLLTRVLRVRFVDQVHQEEPASKNKTKFQKKINYTISILTHTYHNYLRILN